MNFFQSPWFRFGLAGLLWFVGFMSFRMVRIYRGQALSTTVDPGGSPSLIAVSQRRAWLSYASILPVLFVRWPALLTYLFAIQAAGSAVWVVRCKRGLPPFAGNEAMLGEQGAAIILRQQMGALALWCIAVVVGAIWLGV